MKVILRIVKESDWSILTQIRNESQSRKASLNTKKFRLMEYKQYIKKQLEQCKKNKQWVIEYDGKIIGHSKVINQELGYIITKSYQNKGLGTKVIKKLFNEVIKLGYSKVYVLVKSDQPIALWFAIKNGFNMIDLVSDDHYSYAYKLVKKIDMRRK